MRWRTKKLHISGMHLTMPCEESVKESGFLQPRWGEIKIDGWGPRVP